MYRTGDLARYLPDGNLEFLGRRDHQVKLRGYRIELGEIETRLRDHPAVREAVVIAREGTGDRRLVAYVTTAAGEGDDAISVDGASPTGVAPGELVATLRGHLADRLPDYMVPSAFVRLEALPTTPNGKLDRGALPAPDDEAVFQRVYQAPEGELEEMLAALWSELLGLDRVGRHDDFFDLGAHSLLAVRLLNRISEALGVEVPVTTLFAEPSLARLAGAIGAIVARSGVQALPPSIGRVSREAPLAPSFAQQRLWFLARLGAGATYHVPMGLRLRGALDADALRRGLDRLLARHEALRSVFVSVGGEPQVELLPEDCGFALVEEDLEHEPRAAERLEELCRREAHAPFDLERGPLIRGRLIRLGPDDHVFLVTQHHIVSDEWSMGVLTRELGALYRAFAAGRDDVDPLAPLDIQYPDYAAWQREWLSGDRLEAQVDYWRRNLAGAPALLELPTDRPRPAEQSFAGGSVGVHIDAELTGGLKRISQEHGTTLFMTVLAAWAAVLARLSGQDDVVIGTPTANRGRRELEDLIGFFVNTLALRIDLSGEPSLAELLARARTAALGAQDHQDLPFEQVVEIVSPPRRLDHSPVFQVLFAWQNREGGELDDLPGLSVERAGGPYDIVRFDLELSVGEDEGSIAGGLLYSTALFDAATVERHRDYLVATLRALVADADQRAARVDLIGPAERSLVLGTWNQTEAASPDECLIHRLFEEQVRCTPASLALVHGDLELSYAELDRRANRIAHRLVALGVGPDGRVALCAGRSIDQVVGLLGILKAGGAYLPLEPSHPRQRLEELVRDADPVLLVCDASGKDALGPGLCGDRLVLALGEQRNSEQTASLEAELDGGPHVAGLTPAHLACVMYTSGSTGRAKGVAMPHSVLANLFAYQVRSSAPGLRTLQLSALSFDVSSQEMFSTWASGGTVVLTDEDTRRDPAALLELLSRDRIERLFLPFAAFQALAAAAREPAASGLALREVITAGEQLIASDAVRAWFGSAGAASGEANVPRLVNQYGPTETHVATACQLPADSTSWTDLPPIGRPIAGTRVYLLDEHGEPVPLGAVGELCIGGACVARGYLDPELTAERFVADPFGPEPGARMYRTGDQARHLSDGNLEFLGRTDHQIKVRGYRIELGEIEARLSEHPTVREAVVVVREHAGDSVRLVAYVTTTAAGDPADDLVATLRRHLADRLPEYMVPSAFVRLEALPSTRTGKVDRAALPAPDGEAVFARDYQAPEGTIEETLAALWVELLGLVRVGRRDSFFELGGHSLLAVRLQSRLSEALGVELPLTAIFTRPTLAALAGSIATTLDRSGVRALPPIGRVSREGALALSFAQQRLWFLAQLGVGTTYHLPMGMRLFGALDTDAFRRSLDCIVARHEALRSVFVSVGGAPQIKLLPEDCGFDLVEDELTSEPEAERRLDELLRREAHAPFDLGRGPLIRGRLIRLGPEEHVFLLTQHHIVSDEWSIGVLTRELGALYRAFAAGGGDDVLDPLPPLAIQYPDYAAWQREWLSGERLEAQVDYWRRTLADAPALLELPTDRPRPAEQSFAGDFVAVHLDAELTRGLERVGQEHGTTLFMVLLAAWASVLARLSGQDDLVIGTPTANRGRREVEGLVGFFVNTLALRIDLSGEPSLAELLARVRAAALGAQDHQDLPFEQVVEVVAPPRHLHRTPVFQVMFAWASAGDEACFDWPGLRAEPVAAPADTAKFDLELILGERGGSIAGGFHFASALFDAATIERYRGYLVATLRALVADAGQPVARVELLGPAERALLVDTWNQTEAPYPGDRCIHQLFADQVRRTPEAIALVNGEVELSYAELDRQANILAHRLIEEGVRPGDRVAILAERSRALVVAELAILKAGAAYVPLDPRAPAARKAWMVADCAARLVLTGADAAVGTEADVAIGVATLAIDEVVTDPAPDPGDPASPVSSHDPAYVMYTSGSTGTPKGVVVPHRAVVRLVFDNGYAAFSASDRIAFVSNPAFDASTMDVWAPLLTGGRMVVVDRATVLDPARFARSLDEQAVTVLSLTTGLFNRIAPRMEGAFRRLRTLIIGGDVVDPRVLARVWSHGRPQHLVNTYGPTETTLFATSYELTDEPDPARSVPIGRPIANTRIYLLDRHGGPVPRGAAGEIAIGGAGVALGYLDRSELTAERFVRDPFSAEPDARMYRTGDLARHLPDGNLEFLGRTDNQVKVRGYRIELGEIEARLCEHPAVREAVVVARDDAPGDRRLVAYVVPAAQDAPSVDGTRTYRLPNDLVVAHLNRNETDFLYRDIFVNESYAKHGINSSDDSCIFDVGSNIGMFLLWAHSRNRNARFYCFEPSPILFEILRRNVELHGCDARLFDFGLSSTPATASFSYYPKFSFMSGLYADAAEDKALVRSFLRKEGAAGGAAQLTGAGDQLLEQLLDDRFSSETTTIQLRTLSDVIAEEGVERIDWLKINVEKAEEDVLLGVRDADWARISQVSLELHDTAGRLERVSELFRDHGFDLTVEKDWSLDADQNVHYLYARRGANGRARSNGQGANGRARSNGRAGSNVRVPSILSVEPVRAFLEEQLPDYMVPSAFVVLDALPLTPNGKLDREALPAPGGDAVLARGYEAPEGPIEEALAGFWAELLGLPRVGRSDHFFELGGHSLLAVMLHSRLYEALGVELPLTTLFARPTLAALAEAIGALRSGVQGPPAPSIGRVPREAPLAPSFAQQRLWFLARLGAGATYHIPIGMRFSGALDRDALRRSLDRLVARHEALRSVFVSVGGAPQVEILPEGCGFALVEEDLEHEPRAAERLEELCGEEAHAPFDLERGPLIRGRLVRLGPEEHVFLLTQHHIVSDGWSMGVFTRELAALYGAFAAGGDDALDPLPPLDIQYPDYAAWQREWLSGDRLEAQVDYWRRNLAGAPALLELPTDRPRPGEQSSAGRFVPVHIDSELTRGLERISQERGTTLFMTVLAAWAAVLGRLSGQDDVVIGTPTANRSRREIEGLIGFFVNTLALRIDLSGEPSLAELLARVRTAAVGAQDHQDLPFEQVVEIVAPPRRLDHSPVFQVLFAWENADGPGLALPGLTIGPAGAPPDIVRFDLELSLGEDGGAIVGGFRYSTAVFDAATIERHRGYLVATLRALVADADRPVARVSVIGPAERALVVDTWNQTEAASPDECLIHRLFEEQVRRTPATIALVHGDLELSYADLDRRANRIAHELVALGVGPDAPVALCAGRSIDQVVGLLGILKAGGAYLPLEPGHPRQRLEELVRDADPVLLVCDAAGQEALGPGVCGDRPVLALGEQCTPAQTAPLEAELDGGPDVAGLTPAHLACVTYTSGSTGLPKGVAMPHSVLANLFAYQVRSSARGLRTLQLSALSFDVSSQEMFSTWASGGTVVLTDEDTRRDPAALLELLSRDRIERLFLPFAAFQALAAAAREPAASRLALREVITAGEQLIASDAVRAWFGSAGGASGEANVPRLVNQYGPTETHVATASQLPADATAWPDLPPIGRPIAGTRIYLLDEHGEPVPLGAVGELYIGGACVARGYLDRPELTARAIRRRSVRPRAGRAHLPHGRPGPVPGRRQPRVPGQDRSSDQGPRLPDRARRDRGPTVRAPDGTRGGGGGARPCRGQRAPGGLRDHHGGRRPGGRSGRNVAPPPGRSTARVHGAVGVRPARGAALHPDRQGRPRGAARPRR